MHPHKIASGVCLLTVVALLCLAGGCSDEKTPASPSNTGLLTDPEFIQVQDQVNVFLDSAQNYFAEGFENIYKAPVDTENVINNYGPMGPTDTATFGYYDGWYIVYISRNNAYTASVLVDSVQYRDNGEVIEDPSGLDYLHFIRKWDFVFKNTNVSHVNMSAYLNLEYSGLDQNVAAINGTKDVFVKWVYVADDSTVEAQYDMDVAVNDINLSRVPNYPWSSGCPISGNIEIDINQSYLLSTDEGKTLRVRNWVVSVTFDNGEASISVSSEGKTWNYARTICLPPSN